MLSKFFGIILLSAMVLAQQEQHQFHPEQQQQFDPYVHAAPRQGFG